MGRRRGGWRPMQCKCKWSMELYGGRWNTNDASHAPLGADDWTDFCWPRGPIPTEIIGVAALATKLSRTNWPTERMCCKPGERGNQDEAISLRKCVRRNTKINQKTKNSFIYVKKKSYGCVGCERCLTRPVLKEQMVVYGQRNFARMCHTKW